MTSMTSETSTPETSYTPRYAPPAYPPPRRPMFQATSKIPYAIDLELLAHQGWVSLPFQLSSSPESTDDLYKAFSDLFSSSAQFFALSDETKERYIVHPPPGRTMQSSEEGYSNIPGEKCMFTVRRMGTTPTEFDLREKAATAWSESATVMRDVLVAIEETLAMRPGTLVRLMGPKLEVPSEGESSVATLLRMFRYERPRVEPTESTSDSAQGAEVKAPEPRVVSETHKDLGLLSLVVGHTPGLECWDPVAEQWVSCEEEDAPSDNINGGSPGVSARNLHATLLVGHTLAKFTNYRYAAGRHRVFVHPMAADVPSTTTATSDTTSPETLLASPYHRFSLVHALRAHLPLHVSSDEFTTAVTGLYHPNVRFSNVSVWQVYKAISGAHWNVNISVEERKLQELRLSEKAAEELEVEKASAKSDQGAGEECKEGLGSKLMSLLGHQPIGRAEP